MPYDNRDRLAKFYESAFGWQMEMLGDDMGSYVVATTTETDQTGPKKPGAINGGFFPKNLTGPRSILPSSSPWTISRKQCGR
jgi:predicted enzyme related to lactoylglutathione lyase